MLAVHVELLHGTIRAGSADDLAVTGRDDPGEWPPSPARLFSAFVAADGTQRRMRVTDGSELLLLEEAPAPIVLADRWEDVCRNPMVERFVVEDRGARGSVQEYIARKNTLVRPPPRLSPRVPMITYIWPDLVVPDADFENLTKRAARIGYLGCADSPVRVRVSRDASPQDLEGVARTWTPADGGATHLPVPFPGLVEVLDRMFDDFSKGAATRRSWYRAERQAYQPPGDDGHDAPPAPDALWLRFDKTVSGRHVLLVTEALRNAVLASYERHVAGDRAGVPGTLHGHGFAARGYDHASWLALPDVGHAHGSGRIYGAAVVLPAGTEPETFDGVRAAIWHLRELWIPGGYELAVAAHEGASKPWASNPSRWLGPARQWVSAFPVVHERWSKKRPGLEEIARWCRHAGYPTPVSARLVAVPLLPGAVALMPHEARRRAGDGRPYSHLAIEFPSAVMGPVVLGRMRHFGLGLMAPLRERVDHTQASSSIDGTAEGAAG